jgi:MtN3 and saliva related transmembrane protein
MTDTLGWIAASYGVLMAVSPALQIRRMLQRRSSADVSLSYLMVLEVGFGLWIAYGISLPNVAIIVPNVVAVTVGLATILVARHFRRGAASNPA